MKAFSNPLLLLMVQRIVPKTATESLSLPILPFVLPITFCGLFTILHSVCHAPGRAVVIVDEN